MATLASKIIDEVGATDLHFIDNTLCIVLSDGREVSLAIDQVEWLDWLAKATPEQRAKWTLEPGGFAIYWEDLDDGMKCATCWE